MVSKFLTKLSTFADHYQILFTLLVALCVISMSWAIEQILDIFILPHKPLHGYLSVIIISLLILWLTKHLVLHVM